MFYVMLLILTLLCFSRLIALAEEGEDPFTERHPALLPLAYAHGREKHNKNAVPEKAASSAMPSDNRQTRPSGEFG